MSVELKIPEVGESIREVQIGRWLRTEGDNVERDEDIVELETDKASMQLSAPAAGVLTKILKVEGETVEIGEVVGQIDEAPAEDDGAPATEDGHDESLPTKGSTDSQDNLSGKKTANATGDDGRQKQAVDESLPRRVQDENEDDDQDSRAPATPSGRRALREHGLSVADIDAEGPQIRRSDVVKHAEQASTEEAPNRSAETEPRTPATRSDDRRREELVPMSLIRRRIAERLVQAQQQAALLTTFNEIDLSAVKQLRQEYRERFMNKYGIKLGFMSFFVKAVLDALKQYPELNAEVRDDQIAFRNFYDIGIAIGSGSGLVVPVLRDADRLSFAEIEIAIDDFAVRAREKKLAPDDLQGGTFTITNGGIYGSLLSTPIVNPPQSGVLGMHSIQDRPVALHNEVVVRPMMYVALSYDHRLVDGREAVMFLRRVKEVVETPSRMLLEV